MMPPVIISADINYPHVHLPSAEKRGCKVVKRSRHSPPPIKYPQSVSRNDARIAVTTITSTVSNLFSLLQDVNSRSARDFSAVNPPSSKARPAQKNTSEKRFKPAGFPPKKRDRGRKFPSSARQSVQAPSILPCSAHIVVHVDAKCQYLRPSTLLPGAVKPRRVALGRSLSYLCPFIKPLQAQEVPSEFRSPPFRRFHPFMRPPTLRRSRQYFAFKSLADAPEV